MKTSRVSLSKPNLVLSSHHSNYVQWCDKKNPIVEFPVPSHVANFVTKKPPKVGSMIKSRNKFDENFMGKKIPKKNICFPPSVTWAVIRTIRTCMVTVPLPRLWESWGGTKWKTGAISSHLHSPFIKPLPPRNFHWNKGETEVAHILGPRGWSFRAPFAQMFFIHPV